MIRTATTYPASSRVTLADYKTKEALQALVAPKTDFEFNKCQGCLESSPDITVCSTCLQRMLRRRVHRP